jgi:hypothetical protein
MNTVHDLSDNDLEVLFFDVDLIRDVLDEPDVVYAQYGLVDINEFARLFAINLENLIDAEIDNLDWHAAWENNYEWGLYVAHDINYMFDTLSEND